MRHAGTLSAAFGIRIKAVQALLRIAEAKANDQRDLRILAGDLDEISVTYGDAKVALPYAAFADLLRTVAMLVDWRNAVLSAESDADRFLRSAKARQRIWAGEFGGREETADLANAASGINDVSEIEQVEHFIRSVAAVALPVGIFAGRRQTVPYPSEQETEAIPKPTPQPNIAFLRFLIDGAPAGVLDYMSPFETHDIEIDLRVSHWPATAEYLSLSLITAEPPDSYNFPTFRFDRPAGEAPYHLSQRGRALLKAAQAFRTQPFEFKYAAEFGPHDASQAISVVGHRTLRIEGVDVLRAPLRGYSGIDRRILQLRNDLRQEGVP